MGYLAGHGRGPSPKCSCLLLFLFILIILFFPNPIPSIKLCQFFLTGIQGSFIFIAAGDQFFQ